MSGFVLFPSAWRHDLLEHFRPAEIPPESIPDGVGWEPGNGVDGDRAELQNTGGIPAGRKCPSKPECEYSQTLCIPDEISAGASQALCISEKN